MVHTLRSKFTAQFWLLAAGLSTLSGVLDRRLLLKSTKTSAEHQSRGLTGEQKWLLHDQVESHLRNYLLAVMLSAVGFAPQRI